MRKITLIPGDGIGPEISKSVIDIFKAADVQVEFEIENAGEKVYNETGELIPDSLYKNIEKNKIALKGPITTPIGKGFRSINVYLRKKYDLYSNVRPIRTLPGIKTKYDNINLVLAGHSHNGQINIPYIKKLFLPEGSKKYYNNYYKVNNTNLYISSGLGESKINFRLFNKPSINFYRINKIGTK